ncbi:MAG: hypothetical protein SW833_21540 [Cyanobacteriota bacterium]|nr:hypothetical protein [Cyanobacteriota bacterium]
MKVIAISQRSKLLNELLQQAREYNLILQSADGEQFVLAKIADEPAVRIGKEEDEVRAFDVGESDDFEEEIRLTRQNTALMNFLDERATDVKPGSGTSLEKVRQRLEG